MGSSAVVSLTVIPALLEATRPKFIFGKDGEAEASSRRIA
jgi:hypothetical protein